MVTYERALYIGQMERRERSGAYSVAAHPLGDAEAVAPQRLQVDHRTRTGSPTRITPSSRMSARSPPRCTSARSTGRAA